MFEYPKNLDYIFEKLLEQNIHPIIIGGFVRDFFLKINSKDIDIELYGVTSLHTLETILSQFGSLNCVGKSFGIYKLATAALDLDFSLPRLDSKVAIGHKGFEVTIKENLDFKTATSRRDFTVNAIGYDVASKQILDPFSGLEDIKKKKLRAVDLEKFAEDPLRVLRAVQFSARFNFTLEGTLVELCKTMIQNALLKELPRERLFEELKKVMTKAQKPSDALLLLQNLGAIQTFPQFSQLMQNFDFISQSKLTHKQLNKTINALIDIMFGDKTQVRILRKISQDLQRVTPLLQGKDLITLGLKPSKQFGEILETAYQEQIKGKFTTKKDALLFIKTEYI